MTGEGAANILRLPPGFVFGRSDVRECADPLLPTALKLLPIVS
jgi:hypothetical protein